MTVISVIIGSTREGHFSEKPAHWIFNQLKKKVVSMSCAQDLVARMRSGLAFFPSERSYIY